MRTLSQLYIVSVDQAVTSCVLAPRPAMASAQRPSQGLLLRTGASHGRKCMLSNAVTEFHDIFTYYIVFILSVAALGEMER